MSTRSVSPASRSVDPLSDRLILRDGSTASLRIANPPDREAIRSFFHSLSPESRYQRFFTNVEPTAALVDRFCDSSDPRRGATLVAVRSLDGESSVIAVGSYLAVTTTAAEVAFAVDDRFHGKGLATSLLERLAVVAANAGFTQFQATTLATNTAMLDVFRDSGFQIRSKLAGGCVEVELALLPSFESVARADERDRLATAQSIVPLLEPHSVAVIGASREPSSLGRRVLDAIVKAGFAGPVYPVNPEAPEVAGRRAYRSARDLPKGVDLAVVAVPRHAVLSVVEDCAVSGVKALVVITAGFAEINEEGRALQEQLVDKVRRAGMRMVGPNCMGLLNTSPGVQLNASFSPIVPPHGRVALSSQSGALGLAILALAAERGVGLSTFVSVGNKADVSSNDLLQYWEGDSSTGVILLYLESFGNPRRFAQLARRIARKKPIVAVKAGRTRAGSRAAGSHTAALAASDVATAALFRQAGVIRADTIDEMFDVAACLDMQPLPQGRRVAIVTNAGGPGILAVDACEAAGLTVVEFSAATRQRLAGFLPAMASIGNPVDMVASASPDDYCRAIEVTLMAEETDALIVIYTPVDASRSADILSAIRRGIAAGRGAGATGKPILACLMAETGRPSSLALETERVPAYAFPENAARALAKTAAYAVWRAENPGLFWTFSDIHSEEARALCRRVVDERGDDWLTPEESRRVLDAYGLPVLPGVLARSADEAAAVAAVFGFPVVCKTAARGLIHKTEIGGVKLNLADEESVRRAFDELVAAGTQRLAGHADDGVLVQPMVNGIEMMVGITQDPLFGSIIAFGTGGVLIEILGDVRFRLAPLTDHDADDLLHETRGFALLQGYRGRPAGDIESLKDILLRISRLALDIPEVLELDLNPVIVLPPGHGCRIADMRIRVGRGKPS